MKFLYFVTALIVPIASFSTSTPDINSHNSLISKRSNVAEQAKALRRLEAQNAAVGKTGQSAIKASTEKALEAQRERHTAAKDMLDFSGQQRNSENYHSDAQGGRAGRTFGRRFAA